MNIYFLTLKIKVIQLRNAVSRTEVHAIPVSLYEYIFSSETKGTLNTSFLITWAAIIKVDAFVIVHWFSCRLRHTIS